MSSLPSKRTTWADAIRRGFPGGLLKFQAHQERAEDDIKRWLPESAGPLFRGAVHGSEFYESEIQGPWSEADVAFLAVRLPSPSRQAWLASNPWAYKSFPTRRSPVAVMKWWIWIPKQAGFIEGDWHPRTGPDWLTRGLRPDAAATDLERLRQLWVNAPDATRTGRLRLEDDAEHPWRDFATNARQMRRDSPRMKLKDIAAAQGISAKQLGRYLRRLEAEEEKLAK